ncbi:MAG: hypothetical protein ABI679_13565 [Gemmatimonadota bacterium]
MFEGLRSRIEQFLAQHTAPADARASIDMLHASVLDAKVSVSMMRDGLQSTERELVHEKKQLDDAERRGKLAAQVADQETVSVAERYAIKHGERVAILERKLVVQRDELVLAEREVNEMTSQLRSARQGLGTGAASAGAAWRDLESAGGVRPETDLQDDLLKSNLDRARREAAADAQLAHLKRKLGKEPPTDG